MIVVNSSIILKVCVRVEWDSMLIFFRNNESCRIEHVKKGEYHISIEDYEHVFVLETKGVGDSVFSCITMDKLPNLEQVDLDSTGLLLKSLLKS
jgi:hypothetical protein